VAVDSGNTRAPHSAGSNTGWTVQSNEGHAQGWHVPSDHSEVIESQVSSILHKRKARRRMVKTSVLVLMLLGLLVGIAYEISLALHHHLA